MATDFPEQLFIANPRFWEVLPSEEKDATPFSGLPTWVSHEDIVVACIHSPALVVTEVPGLALVSLSGVDVPDTEDAEEVNNFVEQNPGACVIVPKDGCAVDYVFADQCNSKWLAFPRFPELEDGQGGDPFGLLSEISRAVGLKCVRYDPVRGAVARY